MTSSSLDPKRLTQVFEALANERRLKILDLVADDPRTPSEVAAALSRDCTWPAVSRHLRILEAAGLIRLYSELGDDDRKRFVVLSDRLNEAKDWLNALAHRH